MKKNKNILITGSSRGIGLSIAIFLADKGHNVFITGRDENVLKNLALKYSFSGFLAIDLLHEGAEVKLMAIAEEKMGIIDVLINNAGLYVYNSIEKTTTKEEKELLRLNTEVPFLLSKQCVPLMKNQKWGRIINIGSISGVVGEGYASLYSMTKSALLGFSKALALELAEFNITVNTINPGWVDTDLIDDETLNKECSKNEILDMIPQRRFVEPLEIAELCNFLISENAKGITGQSINVCAGLSIG